MIIATRMFHVLNSFSQLIFMILKQSLQHNVLHTKMLEKIAQLMMEK